MKVTSINKNFLFIFLSFIVVIFIIGLIISRFTISNDINVTINNKKIDIILLEDINSSKIDEQTYKNGFALYKKTNKNDINSLDSYEIEISMNKYAKLLDVKYDYLTCEYESYKSPNDPHHSTVTLDFTKKGNKYVAVFNKDYNSMFSSQMPFGYVYTLTISNHGKQYMYNFVIPTVINTDTE